MPRNVLRKKEASHETLPANTARSNIYRGKNDQCSTLTPFLDSHHRGQDPDECWRKIRARQDQPMDASSPLTNQYGRQGGKKKKQNASSQIFSLDYADETAENRKPRYERTTLPIIVCRRELHWTERTLQRMAKERAKN